MSTDFGPACGYTLLDRNAEGGLQPTPTDLAAWLARPEPALVPESCRAETRLPEALQRDPLRPVPPAELAAPKDADARENCAHFLALRDALVQAGTPEGWLLGLWRSGSIRVPPLLIDHGRGPGGADHGLPDPHTDMDSLKSSMPLLVRAFDLMRIG